MSETVWCLRTLIVPVAIVQQCRDLCAAATPAGAGMFTTPLSPTGELPATHYVSSGLLDVTFAALMDSPEAMLAGLTALGITSDLATCQAILSASDVSEDEGHAALERMGLLMIPGEG